LTSEAPYVIIVIEVKLIKARNYIMAYVSKEDKASLAPAIKAVLKKYKMKGSISVQNYSTLVVKVSGGALDFSQYLENAQWAREYLEVNEYHIDNHYADNVTIKDFLNELHAAMKGPDFFDESDAMTDYFQCSHYVSMNIGSFNKPYSFTG